MNKFALWLQGDVPAESIPSGQLCAPVRSAWDNCFIPVNRKGCFILLLLSLAACLDSLPSAHLLHIKREPQESTSSALQSAAGVISHLYDGCLLQKQFSGKIVYSKFESA